MPYPYPKLNRIDLRRQRIIPNLTQEPPMSIPTLAEVLASGNNAAGYPITNLNTVAIAAGGLTITGGTTSLDDGLITTDGNGNIFCEGGINVDSTAELNVNNAGQLYASGAIAAIGDALDDYNGTLVQVDDNAQQITLTANSIYLTTLPSTDPHSAGQLYAVAGVLHVSAG